MSKRHTEAQSHGHHGHGGDDSQGGGGPGSGPIVSLQSGAEAAEKPTTQGDPSEDAVTSAGQVAAEGAEPAPEGGDAIAALRAEIEKLKAELREQASLLQDRERAAAELKDKYLRALAESENVRRRMRQQSEDTVRRERENLLRDLLPVVDNLDRAVGAARGGDNGKSIVEGVEMVLAALLDFLKRQGVTPQTAVGQPFDPARHEAIDHVSSGGHPPNTVVEEAHRGYQIGERVLRPARVVVAKGADEAASPPERKNGESQA